MEFFIDTHWFTGDGFDAVAVFVLVLGCLACLITGIAIFDKDDRPAKLSECISAFFLFLIMLVFAPVLTMHMTDIQRSEDFIASAESNGLSDIKFISVYDFTARHNGALSICHTFDAKHDNLYLVRCEK